MVNVELLKDKIEETGMPIATVSKRSGILRQTLYNRFKDPAFTIEEVSRLQETLNLTKDDIADIFFA